MSNEGLLRELRRVAREWEEGRRDAERSMEIIAALIRSTDDAPEGEGRTT